jgi:hypothetical protein
MNDRSVLASASDRDRESSLGTGFRSALSTVLLSRSDVTAQARRQARPAREGLVIPTPPFTGTPGPVNTINASLYCGPDSNPTPADATQQVPISRTGDARIHDASFTAPATCLAPVILVHPNGLATTYIALDGWRLS